MKRIIKQLKHLNFKDVRHPHNSECEPEFILHKFVATNPEIAPIYVLNIEVHLKQKRLQILYHLEHGLEHDLIHFSSNTNIKSKINYYLDKFYANIKLMSYLGFELVSSPNAIGLFFYKEIKDLVILVKYRDFVPFSDFSISVYSHKNLYFLLNSHPLITTTYNNFNLKKCLGYSIKKMGL